MFCYLLSNLFKLFFSFFNKNKMSYYRPNPDQPAPIIITVPPPAYNTAAYSTPGCCRHCCNNCIDACFVACALCCLCACCR